MRSNGLTMSLFASVCIFACGGQTPAQSAAAPAPAVSGTVLPVTQAQIPVAHYRTADGVYGLVLDRTGGKPKLQLDGQKDIVELTLQEDRSAGELRGYFLVAPDGKRPLYITAGGELIYQHGSDALPLNSDRSASPLPPATVTGTYVTPPLAYQATVDRLTAIAVTTKLRTYKPEDSANLAKVDEAIRGASDDMFVHYASRGATSWLPRLELVPDFVHGVEFGGVARESGEKWDPKAVGLAKYGGRNEGFSDYDTPKGNHMQVMTLVGYPRPLPDGAPGLVWDVSGTQAVFVTLDGGRYVVELSDADKGQTLEAGAGPESGWPPPIQNALIDVSGVTSLAKIGVLPQTTADDLLALDEAWSTCAAKTWAGAQRAIDKGQFTEADHKDWVKKVRTGCASPIEKQEKMLVHVVESRIKERQALYARARERAAAVGSPK